LASIVPESVFATGVHRTRTALYPFFVSFPRKDGWGRRVSKNVMDEMNEEEDLADSKKWLTQIARDC